MNMLLNSFTIFESKMEYNDIPGLSGFTDELKYELADVLKRKLSNQEKGEV